MKNTGKKRVYAEINKVEDQDDGTIKVYGIASTDQKDSDGETVTADCMRAAIPDYMKFGAVREMHQPSAAGTALEIEVGDDGVTTFSAHIVDAEAVKKVKTNVYKGFSIGGKVTERDTINKTIIKGLNLIEVSLVDRPANPGALMTMYKAAGTQEDDVSELAELLDAGAMTPGEVLGLMRKAMEAKNTAPDTNGSAVVLVVDDVKKSLWDVSRFASLLQELGYMVMCSEDEKNWEGDDSKVPAALRTWLSQGVAVFKDMAEEETNELMAYIDSLVVAPDVIEAAAKAGIARGSDVIAKAGAKFSKATKASLDKVRGAMKEAEASLADLKYDVAEAEDAAKAAKVGDTDTNGIQPPAPEGVAKTVTVTLNAEDIQDTVNKALAPMQDQINKALKENETLKAQLDAVSKRAAPGKALLKVMSKGADLADVGTDQPDAAAPAEGTPERAEYEMRKVFGGTGAARAG